MKNLLLLHTDKFLGMLLYDEQGNYTGNQLEDCGCSARSYIENVLVGLSMDQAIRKMQIASSIRFTSLPYIGSEDEVIDLFMPLSSKG